MAVVLSLGEEHYWPDITTELVETIVSIEGRVEFQISR